MEIDINNCVNNNMLKKINTINARLYFWKRKRCEKMINK